MNYANTIGALLVTIIVVYSAAAFFYGTPANTSTGMKITMFWKREDMDEVHQMD